MLQARNLIGEVEDQQLSLQYKACYARICDSKRKFLEAEHGPGVSVMRTIKQALDPKNIMNPGKILPG